MFDSLTLPLDGKKEDVGVETTSINSTPASDTFYTATSVLSPDPHDLTSPLSPLPLDVPRSGNVNNIGNSNSGVCGALVDKQNELVSEVPNEDARKIDIPHSKCNNINVSDVKSRFLVKEVDTCVQKALETDNKDMSHLDQNALVASKINQIQQEILGDLFLSPIHKVNDSTHSQDCHTIKGKKASTPIEAESNCDLKIKDSQSVKSRLHGKNIKTASSCSSPLAGLSEPSEIKKTLSYSDIESPQPCNIDNEFSVSLNNNVFPDNGNTKDNIQKFTDVNSGSHYSDEERDLQKKVTQASPEWCLGLSIREKSELISQEAEMEKAAEVLMRLREKSDEGSVSICEQVCL